MNNCYLVIEDNLLNYKNVHKTIQDDYEILQSYVGCFSCHSAALRLKLLGAIFTGFAKYVGFLEDVAKFESAHGLACGYFAVLITALVSEACKLSPDSNSSAGRKEKDNFDWAHLRIPLLESVRRLFDLEMARFLDSSLNRQAIVS